MDGWTTPDILRLHDVARWDAGAMKYVPRRPAIVFDQVHLLTVDLATYHLLFTGTRGEQVIVGLGEVTGTCRALETFDRAINYMRGPGGG